VRPVTINQRPLQLLAVNLPRPVLIHSVEPLGNLRVRRRASSRVAARTSGGRGGTRVASLLGRRRTPSVAWLLAGVALVLGRRLARVAAWSGWRLPGVALTRRGLARGSLPGVALAWVATGGSTGPLAGVASAWIASSWVA